MNRNEFYDIYQHKPGGITKSGQAFIDRIFFPVWEEYGLDFIEPEEDFISGENNKYRIDFIIKTPYKHYLIEVNDYSSHAGNPDAFDKHTKKMDDIRQSILEDSYQCKYIDREIEIKPVLIGITDKEIENNPQRVVDRLNRSFVGDEYLNLLRFSKFEGGIQLLPFQQETLNKINASRDRGDRRGLISLTTGIGKTFISIFHAKHYGGKVLFLAHLKDILGSDGAEGSFKKGWPERINDIGFIHGEKKEFNKSITIATFQSMSKDETLGWFDKKHFDTIIIDECHHSASMNYRKIINYFDPKFLFGMTATPVRTDKKDVTEIFGNNLIHEITRKEATLKGWICAFEYRLYKDNIDYTDIVWNGSRYEEKDLNEKLRVPKRDREILKKYSEFLKGKRIKTIGFCHSVIYAEHMAEVFIKQGYKAKAIHSNCEYLSKENREIITQLFRSNEIDIVFTVNIFNEGVDFPDVECLLMLRPTQSQVIMSQQLGRGLRISSKKENVSVLDFVSNDKKLLNKFEFLGFGKKINNEKDIYYFDNDGNKVIFDYSIYENYLRLQSEQSRAVDLSKVPQKWIDFGAALKHYYANNYYWSVGKQEKDFIKVLKMIQIIDENPDIGTKGQELIIREKNLGTNIRGIDKGKTLGFITGKGDNKKTTKIFAEAKLKCNGEWDKLDLYKYILETQLQKICFFGPQNSDTNKHGNTPNRVPPSDIFSILYIPFIYKVILEVGIKTGDYFISEDEFNFFVVTSTSHFDHEDKVKLIVELRNEPTVNNKEIIKYLNSIADGDGNKGSELDTRITSLFDYSLYLNFVNSKISLDNSSIFIIEEMVNNLERLLEEGNIQMHSDNAEKYLNMLHTSGAPWLEN